MFNFRKPKNLLFKSCINAIFGKGKSTKNSFFLTPFFLLLIVLKSSNCRYDVLLRNPNFSFLIWIGSPVVFCVAAFLWLICFLGKTHVSSACRMLNYKTMCSFAWNGVKCRININLLIEIHCLLTRRFCYIYRINTDESKMKMKELFTIKIIDANVGYW